MAYPIRGREFVVHTDASIIGLGAVLAQFDENRKERPVMYVSRVLRDPETRYTISELEALAIKWAIHEQFYRYLWGEAFKVYTDHAALIQIFKDKTFTGRIGNWVTKLMEFKIEIVHRQGKANEVADALSRNPLPIAPAA